MHKCRGQKRPPKYNHFLGFGGGVVGGRMEEEGSPVLSVAPTGGTTSSCGSAGALASAEGLEPAGGRPAWEGVVALVWRAVAALVRVTRVGPSCREDTDSNSCTQASMEEGERGGQW